MKRSAIVLCGIALAGMAVSVNAQMPGQIGYAGLFMDEAHSYWCANGTPEYAVEMWVCCLPSIRGQICAEFAISYPSNVTKSTVTINYNIVNITLPPGVECDATYCYVCACYNSCQTSWHWIFHQTLYVMDANPSYCEIIPHPGSGLYQFANCEIGYPVEPCRRWTNLFINYAPPDPECLGTAAEPSSWGAIKKLLE